MYDYQLFPITQKVRILYFFNMISSMARSAFQCRSILSFLSSSKLFQSACIFTRGENLVSTSSNYNSFSFNLVELCWFVNFKYSISISCECFSYSMIESQWQIARANSFYSYSTMFECESYCDRSLRQGLVSSRTVGRKLGNLLMTDQFSGTKGALGVLGAGGGGMMADQRRLEVRERDEPRLDLEDLLRLSFIRLLISLMCSSLSRSAAAFKLATSSVLALMARYFSSSYFYCRWVVLFRPSFSCSSLISLSRYSASYSLSIFSALRKASCC